MGNKKKPDEPTDEMVVEPNEPSEPEAPERRRKTRVDFEGHMQRAEAVAYFEAIVEGLRKGSVEFRRGEHHLALDLPSIVEVEVKASRKGHKHKIGFELSWRDDDTTELSISPAS